MAAILSYPQAMFDQALGEKAALDSASTGISNFFQQTSDIVQARPWLIIVAVVVVLFLLKRRR